MVQIIQISLPKICTPVLELYIPHGSDNTGVSDERTNSNVSFISHMVQIIHAASI